MVFWALWLLLSPELLSPANLVLGLAVLLAALVVAATTGIGARRAEVAATPRPKPSRRDRPVPRLTDPDAAGRPRSRAPSAYPTAA